MTNQQETARVDRQRNNFGFLYSRGIQSVLNEEFQRRQGILRQLTKPFGERHVPIQTDSDCRLIGNNKSHKASALLAKRSGAPMGRDNLSVKPLRLRAKHFLAFLDLANWRRFYLKDLNKSANWSNNSQTFCPEVITAIAEAIPVVWKTLAENFRTSSPKLVENAPRIIVALARAIPTVAFVWQRDWACRIAIH